MGHHGILSFGSWTCKPVAIGCSHRLLTACLTTIQAWERSARLLQGLLGGTMQDPIHTWPLPRRLCGATEGSPFGGDDPGGRPAQHGVGGFGMGLSTYTPSLSEISVIFRACISRHTE